ncbi:MAG TPA: protein kinase, partial [Ktedonobacteraceae bacterium]|nr:protein kinase [Ktedonobacteraceae bacterium]
MSTAPHRLGKYEIQQFLGKGNIGEVWKAHDSSNRRDVALKTVYADLQRSDPQFLTRFMNDGQFLVALRHANLVPTLEVNVTRQEQSNEITAYLVTEYIVGQTFANYLQNTSHQGNFPALSEIIKFFTNLGLALDYAYQQEIVHGNLTPDNILLNQQDTSHFPGGEPMLTDVGLAQLLGLAINNYSKVPLYLSPEQAQGHPPSQRSDVYALGVILYEIYTGTVPFRGESSIAILSQHMQSLPTPPALINPIVPPGLSEVILRAMAKDPNTRYPNVSTFAAAIASASTRQSSFSFSQQPLGKGISPPSGQGNSLLGVAQPPSGSGSAQFRFAGRPTLGGLTPKEVSGHMPALPTTPASLPSQAQPIVTEPLSSEAVNAASSTKPQMPVVQPQGMETPLAPQTPVPTEHKKPGSQTQAIPLSALLPAQQVH